MQDDVRMLARSGGLEAAEMSSELAGIGSFRW
jgi:hypothetical protein